VARIGVHKLLLMRDIIRSMGYISVRSARRWLKLPSIDDAKRALQDLAKMSEDIELVYALTFERPGSLTVYTVEEVEESKLNEVKCKMERDGWRLKGIYLVGAKLRK